MYVRVYMCNVENLRKIWKTLTGGSVLINNFHAPDILIIFLCDTDKIFWLIPKTKQILLFKICLLIIKEQNLKTVKNYATIICVFT